MKYKFRVVDLTSEVFEFKFLSSFDKNIRISTFYDFIQNKWLVIETTETYTNLTENIKNLTNLTDEQYFQLSLVWDCKLDLDILIKLQKYVYNNRVSTDRFLVL